MNENTYIFLYPLFTLKNYYFIKNRKQAYKDIKFNSLVSCGTIFILSGVFPDPKMKIIKQFLKNAVMGNHLL